jgi:hypothetical protein
VSRLSLPQRIALRRLNGERFPNGPVQWRSGVTAQTWRSLAKRDLVTWEPGDGWSITDEGRKVADQLAAERAS